MVNKLTNYQKTLINDYLKEKTRNLCIDSKKIFDKEKIPNVRNLVKSKMFNYAALFIYLFGFISAIGGHYILFILLTVLSIIFGVLAIIYDIKFIGDNLR